jgi:hypothetical protein
MKNTLALLTFGLLLTGCSQTPPPVAAPSAAPAVASSTPAAPNFDQLKGEQVTDLPVAPYVGQCVALEAKIKDKLGSAKGTFVPLLEVTDPSHVMLGFVPGVTAKQLDARSNQPLKVSGQLKPIEDADLVKSLEAHLSGKLFKRGERAFYLELSSDPWMRKP